MKRPTSMIQSAAGRIARRTPAKGEQASAYVPDRLAFEAAEATAYCGRGSSFRSALDILQDRLRAAEKQGDTRTADLLKQAVADSRARIAAKLKEVR